MQEAHQNLTLALDAGDMAAWMYDIDKRVFYTVLGNALAGEGLTFEENLNRLHPDDHRMQIELLEAVIRGEKEKGSPYSAICRRTENTVIMKARLFRGRRTVR